MDKSKGGRPAGRSPDHDWWRDRARADEAEAKLAAANDLLRAAFAVAERDSAEIERLREQKDELMVALREEGFELAAAMRIIARRDAEVERLRKAIREVRAHISGDGDTYLVEVILREALDAHRGTR